MQFFVLQDHEKTKTSICTFLSVLVHLNVLLPKLQDKVIIFLSVQTIITMLCINCIAGVFLRRCSGIERWRWGLQWCFSHNFSIRLYALLALKRVWELQDGLCSPRGKPGWTDNIGPKPVYSRLKPCREHRVRNDWLINPISLLVSWTSKASKVSTWFSMPPPPPPRWTYTGLKLLRLT